MGWIVLGLVAMMVCVLGGRVLNVEFYDRALWPVAYVSMIGFIPIVCGALLMVVSEEL